MPAVPAVYYWPLTVYVPWDKALNVVYPAMPKSAATIHAKPKEMWVTFSQRSSEAFRIEW